MTFGFTCCAYLSWLSTKCEQHYGIIRKKRHMCVCVRVCSLKHKPINQARFVLLEQEDPILSGHHSCTPLSLSSCLFSHHLITPQPTRWLFVLFFPARFPLMCALQLSQHTWVTFIFRHERRKITSKCLAASQKTAARSLRKEEVLWILIWLPFWPFLIATIRVLRDDAKSHHTVFCTRSV